MFIKESLRLYPPVWLIARQLKEDLPMESEFNKSGGDIPKGTSAVVHIFTLHRNVNLWEKVEVRINSVKSSSQFVLNLKIIG